MRLINKNVVLCIRFVTMFTYLASPPCLNSPLVGLHGTASTLFTAPPPPPLVGLHGTSLPLVEL